MAIDYENSPPPYRQLSGADAAFAAKHEEGARKAPIDPELALAGSGASKIEAHDAYVAPVIEDLGETVTHTLVDTVDINADTQAVIDPDLVPDYVPTPMEPTPGTLAQDPNEGEASSVAALVGHQ